MLFYFFHVFFLPETLPKGSLAVVRYQHGMGKGTRFVQSRRALSALLLSRRHPQATLDDLSRQLTHCGSLMEQDIKLETAATGESENVMAGGN